MLVPVYVKPGAAHNRVGGSRDDRLVISVTAQAVDGSANEAVIKLLADVLKIPKRDIQVKSGLTSKRKMLIISGEFQKVISELQNQE
ncbi:MAG: DUF167 domain-containing protein [Actinomycetes bacterium]|jgi:uncharacterized protein (TIGR00251 family)